MSTTQTVIPMLNQRYRQTHPLQRPASFGALLLVATLLGYAVYELILLPGAGLPTDEMAVILAGADVLRVGHWLKFGYATGLACLTIGLHEQLKQDWPLWAALVALTGAGGAVLFVASGMVGLRILETAEFFSAASPVDTRTTILIRIVTQSLQLAALFLAGWVPLLAGLAGLSTRSQPVGLHGLGLLVGVLLVTGFVLPEPIDLAGPFLAISWCGWLAWQLRSTVSAFVKINHESHEFSRKENNDETATK